MLPLLSCALLATRCSIPPRRAWRKTPAPSSKVFALDTAWICLHADAIALLPNWPKSKGAVAEKALADAIGIPAKLYTEFL